MKNFMRSLCQLLFIVFPLAVNSIRIPGDISNQVDKTLEEIKKFLINTKNTSVNSLGPINIKDGDDKASIENALEGYRYLETAKGLVDRFFIGPERVESYLASIVPPRPLLEICDYVEKINCDPNTPYRHLDGSCNNLKNPYLGKSSTPFERFLPAMYGDGLSDPRTHSFFGFPLPRPRALSTTINQNSEDLNEDQGLTNLATVFGYFINNDLQNLETLKMKDCCQIQREFQDYSMNFPVYSREAYDTLLSMSRAVHSVCMAIHIPNTDQYFSFYNRKCMQYSRSTSTPSLDCKLSSRNQRNTNTHFLDGSHIYGSSVLTMKSLRNGTKGLMSIFSGTQNGDLLPQDLTNNAGCSLPSPNINRVYCFKSGDVRSNDQPTLTALHTLFIREHNRIAKSLANSNPEWNDEKIFQETRKIVIGELQHIVYNEYLPILLGNNIMNTYGLTLNPTGYSNGYSEMVSPATRSAFASVMELTLATMARATFNVNGVSNKISSSYLNPSIFYKNGNTIDQIVEEMIKQKSQKFDRLVTDELTNRYQEQIPGEGFDLPATIIQRSRDHGLPVYLAWLLFCGFRTPIDFSDLQFHDLAAKRLLSNMYVSVYDLDLVTAGLMETPLPGSKVGPTFACIIGTQFQQLKNGDRFWYENAGIGNFSEKQLKEIKKVTLAQLICANSNITSVQRNVFLPETSTNPRVKCKDLITQDLCVWSNSSNWSEFSAWTQCVGGVRMRFRSCTLNPDGPCVCVGSPIDLKRCPSDGQVSNILSKEAFNKIHKFLVTVASGGQISQRPTVAELNAILEYTVNTIV